MKHSRGGAEIRAPADDYGQETHEKTRKVIFIFV